MKKLIIFLFIILSMLILIGAGGNVEDAAVHKIARADWIVVQCGGDSTLFRGSVDTLLMYPDSLNLAMRESLLTKLDSTGIYYHAEIADSAGALTDSLKVTLTDAKAYTDVRETAITTAYETMVSDSAQALTDSLKVNLSDSKAYALARIADSLAAVTKLTFLNGLTITNPDSGVITDATGIKLVGDVRVTGSVTGTSMGLTSHLYLPLENDASTPTLNFGDDADGIYSSADGKVNIATNGALRAEFSDTGLEFTDQGSSVNSLKIAMVADNTGTKQTGEMNVNYGVNPYIRMSPPNSAGTATPTMDMRSDLISWFNGEDGIDYYFNFNGYDNDGTITYMEDEDRFDFDNDISAGGDITATDYIVGSTSLFTTISDSTQFALDSAKAYTDVREVAITTAYGTMISDSTQALTDSLKVTLTDAKAYTDVRETAINLAMIDSAKAVWDDSTHATEIVFPNALSIRMSSVSVTNPSSSSIAINATTATITADSTRIQNVLNFDSLKNASGFKLYNSHADTAMFTETAFKFQGNQLVNGTFAILNGTATTFTQLVNRLTISGDSLSLRITTNINPWRATSPQSSTFLGINAGKSEASGADNIVIGNNAGNNLIGGSQNVLIGTAVANNTNAGDGTIVGFQAGLNNTAYYSTFYGMQAGYTNTTGGVNSYFGYQAAKYSTGSRNSIFGYQAGQRTTGYGNSIFGAYAGTQGSSSYAGNLNTLMGDSSGVNLQVSNRNVFLGAYSGSLVQTGNRNLIFGDYKGGTSPDSMAYIDNTGKDSTGVAFTLNMTAGVANRGLTIDGKTISNGSYNYGGNNASGNDTYAVTITGITAYRAGLMITFRPVTANTDGCTLNVNAIGAVAIVDQAGAALVTNRLVATSVTMVIYDGTNFVLMNP